MLEVSLLVNTKYSCLCVMSMPEVSVVCVMHIPESKLSIYSVLGKCSLWNYEHVMNLQLLKKTERVTVCTISVSFTFLTKYQILLHSFFF